MKISDFPQDLEPRVGDILEIEQGDVCFEVRIIGITADGYLCEQDNVEGAVLLEGVSLDHDDVADITGYIAEEKVRLDPKCWKGKKIGNPKTKIKGGVRVNNCVPEGQQEVAESTEQSLQKKIQAKRDALGLAREQRRARGQHQQGQREIKLQAEIDKLSSQLTQIKKQDVAEAGPFSYGAKPPRKGSVAYNDLMKRKEQDKKRVKDIEAIGTKNHHVGVAKVTKAVSEGTESQYIAARYIDEFGDGDHWYVKGTPDVIKKFVLLANSLEDETVKGTEYEPGKGMMGGIHAELGNDAAPQWTIVPARNLESIKPIGDKVLQRLMRPNLADGAQEFMSELLWAMEAKGLALVHDDSQPGVAEGVPQPGKSSGRPISWISPERAITKYLTLDEILNSVQGIPYYNEVVKDRDAKDFTWGVTKKVIEYARELIVRPNAYKNWPPIIVVDGKLQDGAHRISTINLMQKRVQPNNPIWKNAKLKVEFGKSDNVRQGVAEGSDNNVYFEVDSENAYNHIMKKFRSVINWDGDTMVAPQKYWGAIQELAYSAGGEAIEVGNEQGVAEGSDKLQGTPVVSLADLGDKDNKKNKYGQTVPKKLKKDDPRVKFHKDEKQGVAEGYTGRETKDGTWRVFKDGQAVAVAGPFKSRDEAHAWIKKHKQGVSEAKSLKKRVRVVQGEHAGKTGWIREIKHGIHSTAPKRYYVDIDGGGQADNLPASALRLLKNQSDSQKGMAEGGYPSPHNYDSDEDYYAAVNRYNRPKGPRPGDDDWEEYAPGDDIPSRRGHRDDDMDEAKYQGREVPLGKKMAGDVAKSKVYVRKPNGKVVKVNFGDKNMTIKKSNPKRRKSFRARHNCDNPGPRWKARYWSCRSW